MSRSMRLHLSDGAAGARAGRSDLLRDLLAGAVLLAAWVTIWAFLLLGVAGPLGSLHEKAPGPVAERRA